MPTQPLYTLLLALSASVLLHAVLIFSHLSLLKPKPPAISRLEVRLTLPDPAVEPDLFEKNTLTPEQEKSPAPPPEPVAAVKRPVPVPRKPETHSPRKFSDYVIYPKAAEEEGREGTVTMLLILERDGTVIDASISASSGHSDLDQAALAAIHRVGRVNAGGKTQLFLSFTFRKP